MAGAGVSFFGISATIASANSASPGWFARTSQEDLPRGDAPALSVQRSARMRSAAAAPPMIAPVKPPLPA
jgi:hypothetical protein